MVLPAFSLLLVLTGLLLLWAGGRPASRGPGFSLDQPWAVGAIWE